MIGTEENNDEMDVDEDAGDLVYNAKDLELLEQLQLGVDTDIAPMEHGPEYLDSGLPLRSRLSAVELRVQELEVNPNLFIIHSICI